MPDRSITVRVPATTANLGPGFDAIGLALTLYANITVSIVTAGRRKERPDPIRRMVLGAVRAAYAHVSERAPRGLQVTSTAEFPVGRGLGASAAARAAGLVAANSLLAQQLSEAELLSLGTELEGHADNIAPALFGGLQVVAVEGNNVARVAPTLKSGLRCAGFIPELSMPTHESRELLPKRLSRGDAVHNSSRAALLVAALTSGAWDQLRVATDDRLHQHARRKLFPRMFDLFEAATSTGAFAAYLSGGGSTVIALTDARRAVRVQAALENAAASYEIPGRSFVAEPNRQGAHVTAGS